MIEAACDTICYFLSTGHTNVVKKEGVGSALVAGDSAADLVNRSAEDAMIDVISAGSALSSAIFSEGSA